MKRLANGMVLEASEQHHFIISTKGLQLDLDMFSSAVASCHLAPVEAYKLSERCVVMSRLHFLHIA